VFIGVIITKKWQDHECGKKEHFRCLNVELISNNKLKYANEDEEDKRSE